MAKKSAPSKRPGKPSAKPETIKITTPEGPPVPVTPGTPAAGTHSVSDKGKL